MKVKTSLMIGYCDARRTDHKATAVCRDSQLSEF
jgi:hypothetical protein